MRTRATLGLFALLASTALAQTQPDAAKLLRKVSETYKGVSQYELVGEATARADNDAPVRAHFRIAFRAPNQYRLEGTIPGLMSDNADLDETVIIHDGTTLWFYLPKPNQYASIAADKLAADREGSAHTPEQTDRVMMEKYRVASDFADGAKLLREEEIESSGAKISCYVVSVPEKGPGPYTWWIDKATNRILREVTDEGSTVYTTIKLGERLPDDLFKFVPPPGAYKIELNQR